MLQIQRHLITKMEFEINVRDEDSGSDFAYCLYTAYEEAHYCKDHSRTEYLEQEIKNRAQKRRLPIIGQVVRMRFKGETPLLPPTKSTDLHKRKCQ